MNIFIEQNLLNELSYKIIVDNLNISKAGCIYYIDKFIQKYPDIYKELLNIMNNNNNFTTLHNLIKFIILNKQLNRCKTCNKEFTDKETLKNKHYCSVKCVNNDKTIIVQRQKTFKQRYGCYSNLLRQEIIKKNNTDEMKQQMKQKRIQTNIKKYGVAVSSQNQLVKEKMKDTVLKRYRR